MLIDLEPPLTINAKRYPGRLIIALTTGGDHRSYGIVPADTDETPPEAFEDFGHGQHAFEIPLDPTTTNPRHYKATAWVSNVYFGPVPEATWITLRAIESGWTVSIHAFNNSRPVITVQL
jgi:hypothetical protein